MAEAPGCEHCGKPLGPNAPAGLCPGCLLRTALEQGAGRTLTPLLPKLRYFGDYELVEEIARGGMGVVYRARQVSLDRIVAVKMMRPGVLASEDEIRRFHAEARTAAGMQHPNIVAIHEVGEFDGLHYFSMDFVEGPSLAELVHEKSLAPQEAARYVKVLAEAVHYAHGKGVLHRDLKPANVLVDPSGSPRITDFGLARPMEGGAGMTVAGALVGTPAYMPPEQAAAEGAPLTPAADCYSLGAILYELLTGLPPFRGPNAIATVRMVQEQKPLPPRTIAPNIGRDLEAICLRCLEKDPARRYQSAALLAADLERFLRGEEVQARPAPVWRNRWLAGAAAIVVLALVFLIVRSNRPAPPSGVILRSTTFSVKALSPVPPDPSVAKKEEKKIVAGKSAPAKQKLVGQPGLSAKTINGQQLFTFRYPQPASAAPLVSLEIEFRDPSSQRSCNVFADPDSDHVGLQVNPLGGAGLRAGGRPGTLNTLDNAVCSVDLSNASVGQSQNTVEVRLPVTFKPGFAGPGQVESWQLNAQTGERVRKLTEGTWSAK